MKTNVVVVIPNWNGEDFIAECLASLKEQSLKHDVLVVDNGSVDTSVEIIESSFPDVRVLRFDDNAGFAGGVNRGIRPALEEQYEYIALFNNDAFADEHWLENLVHAGDKHPEAGIITGKFMRMDKKHIDSTGDCYSIWAMPFPRGRNEVDNGQYDSAGYVFSGTGGASIYRASMLAKIGLFDEEFFAYFEDVDISFRAQLYGWKVWYQPTAVAYHHVSGTSSKLGEFSRFHATKNFYMLYAKNMPARLYWKYGLLFIIQAARLLASSILLGHGLVHIKGIVKAFANSAHITRERRRNQRGRKVSSKEIDALLYKHRPPKIPGL
jgi:hypothetical protein